MDTVQYDSSTVDEVVETVAPNWRGLQQKDVSLKIGTLLGLTSDGWVSRFERNKLMVNEMFFVTDPLSLFFLFSLRPSFLSTFHS